MGWDYGFGPYSWAGLGLMVLFWLSVIFLVVWGIRTLAARGRGDDAMEVLRRRLAAGEITPEEFEKTRRLLQG